MVLPLSLPLYARPAAASIHYTLRNEPLNPPTHPVEDALTDVLLHKTILTTHHFSQRRAEDPLCRSLSYGPLPRYRRLASCGLVHNAIANLALNFSLDLARNPHEVRQEFFDIGGPSAQVFVAAEPLERNQVVLDINDQARWAASITALPSFARVEGASPTLAQLRHRRGHRQCPSCARRSFASVGTQLAEGLSLRLAPILI